MIFCVKEALGVLETLAACLKNFESVWCCIDLVFGAPAQSDALATCEYVAVDSGAYLGWQAEEGGLRLVMRILSHLVAPAFSSSYGLLHSAAPGAWWSCCHCL